MPLRRCTADAPCGAVMRDGGNCRTQCIHTARFRAQPTASDTGSTIGARSAAVLHTAAAIVESILAARAPYQGTLRRCRTRQPPPRKGGFTELVCLPAGP